MTQAVLFAKRAIAGRFASLLHFPSCRAQRSRRAAPGRFGNVRDEQGGVLPGVSLTLRNQATGVARTIVTEADGRYLFAALPPGRYTLHAELSGFAASGDRRPRRSPSASGCGRTSR